MSSSAPEVLAPYQAARELGVSVKTLRRWEAAGKIKATRNPSGHRRYPRSEIDRIQGAAS